MCDCSDLTTLCWISLLKEGYWECSAELGALLKMEIHSFANVFLKSKGICSLGVWVWVWVWVGLWEKIWVRVGVDVI